MPTLPINEELAELLAMVVECVDDADDGDEDSALLPWHDVASTEHGRVLLRDNDYQVSWIHGDKLYTAILTKKQLAAAPFFRTLEFTSERPAPKPEAAGDSLGHRPRATHGRQAVSQPISAELRMVLQRSVTHGEENRWSWARSKLDLERARVVPAEPGFVRVTFLPSERNVEWTILVPEGQLRRHTDFVNVWIESRQGGSYLRDLLAQHHVDAPRQSKEQELLTELVKLKWIEVAPDTKDLNALLENAANQEQPLSAVLEVLLSHDAVLDVFACDDDLDNLLSAW